MKQYKHKQTGMVATQKDDVTYKVQQEGTINFFEIDCMFIENTQDWELIPEILPFSDFKKGDKIRVYDRYLFAIPKIGYVENISDKDGALSVIFLERDGNNINDLKHSGKYFHYQQCEHYNGKPEQSPPENKMEIVEAHFDAKTDNLFTRIKNCTNKTCIEGIFIKNPTPETRSILKAIEGGKVYKSELTMGTIKDYIQTDSEIKIEIYSNGLTNKTLYIIESEGE